MYTACSVMLLSFFILLCHLVGFWIELPPIAMSPVLYPIFQEGCEYAVSSHWKGKTFKMFGFFLFADMIKTSKQVKEVNVFLCLVC